MRISFGLPSLWLSGGVRVVAEYGNRLAERGNEITLVAPRGTLDSDMLEELIHIADGGYKLFQERLASPAIALQVAPAILETPCAFAS